MKNFNSLSNNQSRPFLHNVTNNVKNYYDVSCKMMEHRIKTRLKDLRGEDALHDELDVIWNSLTDEEIEQVEKLPRMWWFQYSDDIGARQQSELDVYPYAQYFVDQKPHLLGDDVSHMKGKPFFGDKTWKPHMAVMPLMVETYEKWPSGLIVKSEVQLVSMSNENSHYEELQRDYDFVGYARNIPIFKKKGI